MSSKFGKYRLVAELGHGGMADVYLAAHSGSIETQGFNKLLVIKRLRANLADEAEFVEMLLDEGKLAARLNHPNVVQTYEIGEQEGRYFISMEYLDGQPLHRILNRGKTKNAPLSMGMGLTFLVDVLAGLHHAHELLDFDGSALGVVHRDISPQNVFVTYTGQIKVVDFGIAKAMGRSAETREGVIKGKITYMAPEQVRGSKEIDRRSDIFAVGVMLWEIVLGDRLWKGMQDVDIVQRLLSGDFPRHPKELKAEIPEELDRIVAKSLEPKKDDRYATALDFQHDLETFLRSTNQMVTGREIGKYISDLFADKQAEVKKVVEAQMKRISAEAAKGNTVEDIASLSGPPSQTTGELGKTTNAGGDVSLAQSETMVGTVTGALGPKKAKKSNKWTYLAMTGAAAAIGAFIVFGQPKTKPVVTIPGPESTAPSGAMIVVTLKAQPNETQFSIDDGPEVGNPYILRVPKENANLSHVIHARAANYIETSRTVNFTSDLVVDMSLLPVPQSVEPPKPKLPNNGGKGMGDPLGKKPVRKLDNPFN